MEQVLQNKQKCQNWLLEGKEWETETVDILAGVTKELSLGPGQSVFEQLVDLEKLMM
jgi:hypothetical protein